MFNKLQRKTKLVICKTVSSLSFPRKLRGKTQNKRGRVTVTMSLMPRAASCMGVGRPMLLAARSIAVRTSRLQSRSHSSNSVILLSSPRIFEEKRDCSQSKLPAEDNFAILFSKVKVYIHER